MDNQYLDYLKKYLPEDKLQEGIEKLNKGISPQYIVGNVDFYGNIIDVNDDVLIPRFETELLVDKTIHYIRDRFSDSKNINIIDIGTGSGCIAIALQKELGCNVVASDVSEKALNVAKKNALKNSTNISFVCSNVFSNIEAKYDVIISNPPYISKDEKIEKIVLDNEPHLALYADDNGLYFYREILKNAKEYLNRSFIIAFEIGEKQAKDIKKFASLYLDDINIIVEKDYSLRDRFVFIFSK